MSTTTLDPDQPEPPTPVEHKYEVRFHIDVYAPSPEKAAEIARDILLDLDTELHADVHQYEYYAPAEDWFPRENEGVWAYFGDRWPKHWFYGGEVKKYVGSSVRPVKSVAWTRQPSK